MFFGTEAFWLFCLTFVSMHHNQLNTRVVYSNEASAKIPVLVLTLATSRGAIAAAVASTIASPKPSGILPLVGNTSNAIKGNVISSSSRDSNRRDDYALKNEIITEAAQEEVTTRQVSGEIIIPEENDSNIRRSTNGGGISTTSATNSDKILIEDTGGGDEENSDIEHIDTILKLATKYKSPLQAKHREKISKHSKNGKNSAKTISENFVWDFKENVGKLLENSAQKENRSNFMTNNAPSGNAGYSSSPTVNSGRSNTLTGGSDATVAHTHLTERRHLVTEKLQYTKEISIKQGRLVGIVRSFQSTSRLHAVDQYLGLPYAEAPTGSRRFMPPVSNTNRKIQRKK